MITKLEAVNRLLTAIGEEPVTSLSAGLDDAEAAENYLDRISHDIQALGWHANTDKKVSTAIDGNGNILWSADWLEVDTTFSSRHINVAPRVDINDDLRKLFDMDKRTFVFTTTPIYLRIVRLFDFEDTTSLMQAYIASEAAVRFQASELSSGTLNSFLVIERDRAWAAFQDAEAEAEDNNILTDNSFCAGITRRNSPYWGV